MLLVVALFLILQSYKKSGFYSPESASQMAEMSLESTTALEVGKGNAAVMKDLEGAVNQRNYPMVGKDQGALDYSSGHITNVEGANAMPVNVNGLPYAIEGYNLLPEFVGESDIETSEKPLLDLYLPSTVVPSVPMVLSPMMPYGSSSPMMSSSPLLPYGSPSSMIPPSPLLPITSDIAGPARPVIGVPGGVVAPI
jgi:hypothetical protein